MPQKPQVRAKQKRNQTKRLAKWRATQEAALAAKPAEKITPAPVAKKAETPSKPATIGKTETAKPAKAPSKPKA